MKQGDEWQGYTSWWQVTLSCNDSGRQWLKEIRNSVNDSLLFSYYIKYGTTGQEW